MKQLNIRILKVLKNLRNILFLVEDFCPVDRATIVRRLQNEERGGEEDRNNSTMEREGEGAPVKNNAAPNSISVDWRLAIS